MDLLAPTQRQVVFYLVPGFDILTFAAAMEAFRTANSVRGYGAYRWRLVSMDGHQVKANCGLYFQVTDSIASGRRHLSSTQRPNIVIVCSGSNAGDHAERSADAWLRECKRYGVTLAGLSTGAEILAGAGLLTDKRCTIHWQSLPGFVERFSRAHVSLGIFEVDGDVYTCAGGAAGFDMTAHLIGRDHGEEVVAGICEHVVVDRVRGTTVRQRLPLSKRTGTVNETLRFLIEKMEENLSEPDRIGNLADAVCLSRRQVERLFRFEFGCSPARYYRKLRLDYANRLLVETAMPVIDVAIACGFVSPSHFARCYRDTYGRSPQQMRLFSSLIRGAPAFALKSVART
ncbi:GlxA family transcriptional regulator [Mesorhizobium sp. DCY119]|uniref:GlxA family transcriptional regulator n=1 Tax=Mesorhizobium sp. DCY119 TaxID=2108445 RepID=UPI000E718008|nr:GlxA family transcriptional regulator [Mesorhizobium sp. DCY119]RJG40637.1 GlxA family transcriptional regulator [Mesorhizobium sp. DCY119]